MKTNSERVVVVVDDDEMNLMILDKGVQEAGYTAKAFINPVEAWEYIDSHPDEVDIALLDKMMPGMNGLDMLQRIKSSKNLRHIPVILQTGDAGVEQMKKGLETGASYYLTKPFSPDILIALLRSTVNECINRDALLDQVHGNHTAVRLLNAGSFDVRTHDEARYVAAFLSEFTDFPYLVSVGIMELLSNSIEHGNLEIGYASKRNYLCSGSWDVILAERAYHAPYGSRSVKVAFTRKQSDVLVSVKDEGPGFDWTLFDDENTSEKRFYDPNGRGISKARNILQNIEYKGCGNEVCFTLKIPRNTAMHS